MPPVMMVMAVIMMVIVLFCSVVLPYPPRTQHGQGLLKFCVRGLNKDHRLTDHFRGFMTGGMVQPFCNFHVSRHVLPIMGYSVSQPYAAFLRFVHKTPPSVSL
jgi:hypothetical protein